MISPCYFIDLDTQEGFLGKSGVLAKDSQKTGIFLETETVRKNLKILTKHATKKGWKILSPVEVFDENGSEKKVAKALRAISPHCKRGSKDAKKIGETVVRSSFVFGTKPGVKEKKFSKKEYEKILKKHKQIVFEKYGYDVFKNPNFLKVLKAGGIKICVVYGVALDYGLDSLVLKLLKAKFSVYVVVDAVKAINEENRRMALIELAKFGARMWNTKYILRNT